VGCKNVFADETGSLLATGVLIRTPGPSGAGQPAWTFKPTQIDVLLQVSSGQVRSALRSAARRAVAQKYNCLRVFLSLLLRHARMPPTST
jgi:hypothetical protein